MNFIKKYSKNAEKLIQMIKMLTLQSKYLFKINNLKKNKLKFLKKK